MARNVGRRRSRFGLEAAACHAVDEMRSRSRDWTIHVRRDQSLKKIARNVIAGIFNCDNAVRLDVDPVCPDLAMGP
ncbi:MAG: hypothetical protein OXL68_02615 [Paracoccaceae bacterium]|nr:hypothetical protein [Paracoccaceae bacterium]